MDGNIKKCPGCRQFYNVKLSDSKSPRIVPLLLFCGHSMCETCVTHFVNFAEPIECRICHQVAKISQEDSNLFKQNKISLYNLYPINMNKVAELALQSIEDKNQNENNTENDFYVNIKELIKNIVLKSGDCVECYKSTSSMCDRCDIIVCYDCFNKSHKKFVTFQKHELRIMGNKLTHNCKSHPNKQLKYYCKDCSKRVCISCFVLVDNSTCYGHTVISIDVVNKDILKKLAQIQPKVYEMFLRLTKTAVIIGDTLTKLSNETSDTAYSYVTNKLDAHCSKMIHSILKQRDDITQQVQKMKISEIDSLKKAKNDVAENIKKAKTIFNSIKSLESNKLEGVNILSIDLTSLLKEAEAVEKFPWYLKQLDSNQSVDLIVKEDACASVEDHFKLEIQERQENSEFKLINTEELTKANEDIPAPPTSIVYPLTLYKGDTRSVKEPLKGTFVTQSSPFYQGTRELIVISHLVSPHNFYVYREIHDSPLLELMRDLQNAAFYERSPSEENVTMGKIYLVYNNVHGSWQRGCIVGIDTTDENNIMYHVLCHDFGSIVAVEIDNLRYIPPALSHNPPPFAVNCYLGNCEPIYGRWTKKDTNLMRNIIDNKRAVIHVQAVDNTRSGSVRLKCDIITTDDGVSVTQALVFHNRARMPVPVPWTWSRDTKKPKLVINNYDYLEGAVEDVVITHIVNPDSFYVRKLHLQSTYEKLCKELEKEYEIFSEIGLIYLPEQTMACIAHIEGYGLGATWARAVVCKLLDGGRVRVLLADIGAVVDVDWSALRQIHKKHTLQRVYATECYLVGVRSLDKKWSPESVALLQSFQNKPLEMDVDDNSCTSLGVTLYDKNNKLNVICINKEMIKKGFAVSWRLSYSRKYKKPDESSVVINRPSLEEQLPEHQPTKSQKPNDEDLEAKGPVRLEVKILNYQSPSLIYVSLVHQQEVFTKLFEDIHKNYTNKITQGKTDWKVGDRCCTIYNQSQTWRRAVIWKLENENAKVFYSDFGCDDTVPVISLREISQELASIGDAAIMCHMHGIIPSSGDEWPSVSKEFLKELLVSYNKIFITKVSKFNGKSMPIELWVYHTIEEGVLEPNTSEWRCLNYKMIEQGLAIPVTQEIEKEKATDNVRVITGSVQDSSQSESMSVKFLKNDSNPSSTYVEIDTSHEESQNSNVVFVSDWIPPNPLDANELTAMPTHVDNNGVIYLHDITKKDTLDVIDKALYVRFSNPDPQAKFEKWTVGEPCIALYFLDNRFYRGRVLEVNNNTSTCLIHYIDYGNEELVSFENLRKSIVLHQIPTQAHKCILNRIRPVNNRWEAKFLVYLHKTIVEKYCHVKIIGPPIDGLIPIELKYQNLCINDHLVDLDMALYTDGSKALVRKYAPTVNETQKLVQSIDSHSSSDCNERYDEDTTGSTTPNNSTTSTYLPFTKTKFKCDIVALNEVEKLQLLILHDNNETRAAYRYMLNDLQNESNRMLDRTSIHKNKACVALFPHDNLYYRASILDYNTDKTSIKVKYVDYGNEENVSVECLKEISEKYFRLPPTALTVTLHGVIVNPDIDVDEVYEKYNELFLKQGPFFAEVINGSDIIPSVELRNDYGQLIYESLIDQNILIKCD